MTGAAGDPDRSADATWRRPDRPEPARAPIDPGEEQLAWKPGELRGDSPTLDPPYDDEPWAPSSGPDESDRQLEHPAEQDPEPEQQLAASSGDDAAAADAAALSLRRIGALAALAVAAIVAAAVVWNVLRHEGPFDAAEQARLAEGAGARWRVMADQPFVWDVETVDDMVVYSAGPDPTVIALDRRSGQERWRVDLGPTNSIAAVDVVADVVIARIDRSDGTTTVRALDPTGETLWRVDSDRTSAPVAFRGGLYRIAGASDRSLTFELLDPVDGATLNVADSITQVGFDDLVTIDGDLVSAVDLASLQPGGPTFPVPDSARYVPVRDVVAVLDGRWLETRDIEGEIVARLELPDQLADRDLSLIAVGDVVGQVVLDGDGVVALVALGLEPTVVWSVEGWLDELVPTDDGLVATVRSVADGSVDRLVVLSTGDEVVDVGDGELVAVASDGVVVGAADGGSLNGFDLAGELRWQLELGADEQAFPIDRAVVVAGNDARLATLTFHAG